MKTKKRFLSILLSLVMVLGLMPGMNLTAYAAVDQNKTFKTGDTVHSGFPMEWINFGDEANTRLHCADCRIDFIYYDESSGKWVMEVVNDDETSYLNYQNQAGKVFVGIKWSSTDRNPVTSGTYYFTAVYEDAPTITVTDVTLNKDSTTLNVGGTETLTATIMPYNATDASVTWSSSDASVATVDNTGKVTAVAAGTATITVTTNDGARTAACTVTVQPATVAVEDVTLNKNETTLTVGDTETLTATITPDNATNKEVTWSSSDAGVAAVDSDGKVTAVSAGAATITVTTNDGGKTAACTVTVQPATVAVEGVTLNKNETTLTVGDTETLTATITPDNATNKEVTWSSNDAGVAAVDSDGKVTAVSAGAATITVTTNDGGKTAVCEVTVNAGNDSIVGKIYNIGDELYLSSGSYVTYYDDDGTTFYTLSSANVADNYEMTYTIPAPEYDDRYGQWGFENITVVEYNSRLYYMSMWLGDGYTDGGEKVTGIKCTGGDGSYDNPYTFELVYLQRVEGSAEGFEGVYDGSSHGITVSVTNPTSDTTVKYGMEKGTYNLDASPTYADAGDYTVYYEVSAGEYSSLRGSAKVNIAKADSSVTTAPTVKTGLVYNETTHALLNGDGVATGGTLQYALGTDATTAPETGWSTSIPEETDSGTYYVWYKVAGDQNHNDTAPVCLPVTIKGTISKTVTFKVANGSWDDGTTADKTVTLRGYEDEPLKMATTDIPLVGGKPGDGYKVGSWDIAPSADVEITADAVYTYTYAEKDTATVTAVPAANTRIYNGNAQELVTTGTAEGGTIQYALGTDETTAPAAGEYTTSIPEKTDVGTYYVWYKVVGDNNHKDTDPEKLTAAITPKTVTVNGLRVAEKDYDGTTAATLDTSSVVFDGLADGDKLTVSGNAEFADPDAGNNKTVNVTDLALGGDSVKNYALSGSPVVITGTIHKLEVKVTAKNQTVSLNGSIDTTVGMAELAEGRNKPLNGHALSGITLTASSTANATASGTITPSNAKIEDGDGNDVTANYDFTYEAGILTVNKADIAPIVTITGWTYGKTASTPNVTGNDGNGSVSYAYAKKGEETFNVDVPKDAGNYTVKATIAATDNYNGSEATADFTIEKAAITITADDKSSKYGDDISELTAQTGGDYVEGDDLGISLSTTATKTSDAGEYDITVTWNENPNYTATLSKGKYTITKSDMAVTATGYSGTYDGEAHGISVDVGSSDAVVYYSETELTAENYSTAGSTSALTYTNAGEYTVFFYVVSGNYEPDTVSGSKTVTITKANGEVGEGQKPTANTGLVYNGGEQALVTAPAELPDGYTKVQYSVDGGTTWTDTVSTGTDAGDYSVTVKYVGDDNHNDFNGDPITVTIDKAVGEAGEGQKPAANTGLVDNGSEQALVTAPAELPDGYTKVQYSVDGGTTWTDAIPTRKEAGSYTVNVKYVGDSNHADFEGDSLNVTIKAVYTVTFNMNGADEIDSQSVVEGETAVKPADPTRNGYQFDGWYQDATFAAGFDFDTPIKADVTIYAKWISTVYTITNVAGTTDDSAHVWVKGSTSDVVITVKLTEGEDDSFRHFTSVLIDGKTLANGKAYTVREGSTIVTLKAAMLQTLSTGTHTVAIKFDNGQVETKLTVKEEAAASATPTASAAPTATPTPVAKNTSAPRTGDESNPGMWMAMLLLSGMILLTVKIRHAGER